MSVSFREQIRNFLLTWEGAEEIYGLLIRMIFARNKLSVGLKSALTGMFGQLSPDTLESDVIPVLIEILLEKRDIFLGKEELKFTFFTVVLKNAILDRISRKKTEDKYSGEMPRVGTGEDAVEMEIPDERSVTEGGVVQRLAAGELVHLWLRGLSEDEIRTFCDFLYREFGNKDEAGFLSRDVSKDARYKKISRLKERLREMNRQDPDYEMFQDREIWDSAFSILQSEVCPGLRLCEVNDNGSVIK